MESLGFHMPAGSGIEFVEALNPILGGGFKDFLCSPLFGEDSHFY